MFSLDRNIDEGGLKMCYKFLLVFLLGCFWIGCRTSEEIVEADSQMKADLEIPFPEFQGDKLRTPVSKTVKIPDVRITAKPKYSEGNMFCVDATGKEQYLGKTKSISLKNGWIQFLWKPAGRKEPIKLDDNQLYTFELGGVETISVGEAESAEGRTTMGVTHRQYYLKKLWLDGKVILESWDPYLIRDRVKKAKSGTE